MDIRCLRRHGHQAGLAPLRLVAQPEPAPGARAAADHLAARAHRDRVRRPAPHLHHARPAAAPRYVFTEASAYSPDRSINQ